MKKVAIIAALLFTVNQTVNANNGAEPLKSDYSINADLYSVDLTLDEERGLLHVSINGVVNREMIISLINVRGQESFHANIQELNDEYTTTIDLSQLGKGLYFFKVDSGDEIRLKKITL